MIITSQRIIFEPHLFNVRRGAVEIPLKDIVEVKERSTYGLMPNGVLIKTKAGQEYKFVVPHRQKIIDLIKPNIRLEKVS